MEKRNIKSISTCESDIQKVFFAQKLVALGKVGRARSFLLDNNIKSKAHFIKNADGKLIPSKPMYPADREAFHFGLSKLGLHPEDSSDVTSYLKSREMMNKYNESQWLDDAGVILCTRPGFEPGLSMKEYKERNGFSFEI